VCAVSNSEVPQNTLAKTIADRRKYLQAALATEEDTRIADLVCTPSSNDDRDFDSSSNKTLPIQADVLFGFVTTKPPPALAVHIQPTQTMAQPQHVLDKITNIQTRIEKMLHFTPISNPNSPHVEHLPSSADSPTHTPLSSRNNSGLLRRAESEEPDSVSRHAPPSFAALPTSRNKSSLLRWTKSEEPDSFLHHAPPSSEALPTSGNKSGLLQRAKCEEPDSNPKYAPHHLERPPLQETRAAWCGGPDL